MDEEQPICALVLYVLFERQISFLTLSLVISIGSQIESSFRPNKMRITFHVSAISMHTRITWTKCSIWRRRS